jgi:hypothetical protein
MALTIEDGSLVSGANSYVTLADARAYAEDRGAVLPIDDDDAEVVILKAMDYLESFSDRFKGWRVERDQALSWPRSGIVIEDWAWNSDEIPRQVISAQLALVLEINAGEDPFNPSPSASLPQTRKKVGPIEVEYAAPRPPSKVSKASPSQTIINLLLANSGLSLVRV